MGFAAGFNAGASAFDAGRRETLDRERLGVEQEQVKAQAARDAKDLAFKGLGIMKDRITNLSTGLQEAFKTSGAPGDFMIKEVDAAVEQYNRIAETAGVGKLTTDMVMASAARPSITETGAANNQVAAQKEKVVGAVRNDLDVDKQQRLIPVKAKETAATIDATAQANRENATKVGETEAIKAFAVQVATDKAEALAKSKEPIEIKNTDLSSMRSQHANLSSEFKTLRGSFETLVDLPNTPQADVARIVAYVKMFDPNSVVKEAEGRNVIESAGAPAHIVAAANKLLGRGTLTPDMRRSLVDAARSKFKGELAAHRKIDSQFRATAAKRFGKDSVSDAVLDFIGNSDELITRSQSMDFGNGRVEQPTGRAVGPGATNQGDKYKNTSNAELLKILGIE